jgi:hypothetical protein
LSIGVARLDGRIVRDLVSKVLGEVLFNFRWLCGKFLSTLCLEFEVHINYALSRRSALTAKNS